MTQSEIQSNFSGEVGRAWDLNPRLMLSPAILRQGPLPSGPSETLLILKSLV